MTGEFEDAATAAIFREHHRLPFLSLEPEHGLFECRANLKLRFLLENRPECLYVFTLLSHDEIQRLLRSGRIAQLIFGSVHSALSNTRDEPRHRPTPESNGRVPEPRSEEAQESGCQPTRLARRNVGQRPKRVGRAHKSIMQQLLESIAHPHAGTQSPPAAAVLGASGLLRAPGIPTFPHPIRLCVLCALCGEKASFLLDHRAPSPPAANSITGPGTKPSASTSTTIATSTATMPADGNGCHGRTGSRKYMATTMRR